MDLRRACVRAHPGSGAVGTVGGSYDSPAEIKQILGSGVARIVGHPYVEGQHTVELSISMGRGGVKDELWADTQTYQVVRTIKYFPAGLPAPPIKSDYTWTPRSAAMVKLINSPQIPAGFRQLAAGTRTARGSCDGDGRFVPVRQSVMPGLGPGITLLGQRHQNKAVRVA